MMPPPAYSETDPGYAPGQASAPAYGGGTEVMVVTGGWDGDRALETVEMFDPRTGQWSFLPNMMGEFQGMEYCPMCQCQCHVSIQHFPHHID